MQSYPRFHAENTEEVLYSATLLLKSGYTFPQTYYLIWPSLRYTVLSGICRQYNARSAGLMIKPADYLYKCYLS
jgi:hypothetical protein